MSPEMLSILVSLLLLDFPYLVLRIVLMVIYGMTTASGLFFALKNALMCLLQVKSKFSNGHQNIFFRDTASIRFITHWESFEISEGFLVSAHISHPKTHPKLRIYI